MLFGSRPSPAMIDARDALPGRPRRQDAVPAVHAVPAVPAVHAVLGTPLEGPWPDGTAVLYLAMGCFWGAEKTLWSVPGVVTTAVGYQGGFTPNPTYEETCTGFTGHTETVLVAYDPARLSAEHLLRVFWEHHDPTQGFRQGNDLGTQYRSAVHWTRPDQAAAYASTRTAYQKALRSNGLADITTQGRPAADAGPFYYADAHHQQYLSPGKNPHGYCPDHGTGVSCPIGLGAGTREP